MTSITPKAEPALSGAFRLSLLSACAALMFNSAAQAQQAPKETVTEELIRLLAEHNALAKEDAARLIDRLRAESSVPATSDAASSTADKPAAVPAPVDPPGRVRVMHLPDSEKAKIREEIKQEVIQTAKDEAWALPNNFPLWANRFKFDGDLRLREEFDFFDSTNDPYFINFQAINSGSPYNVAASTTNQPLPPLYNTTEDRAAFRLRARLGISAMVTEDLFAKFRLATGNTTNPVSTNQTLGSDFNKLSLVLDRAYLEYKPVLGLVGWGGRMPNPFQSTELVWDDDLNFDGLALRYEYDVTPEFAPFIALGGFAVQNTSFDFPSTQSDKAGSRDRWLLASQIGVNWRIVPRLKFDGALAYYRFTNISGELSSPCYAPTAAFSCDSDDSRSAFMQKGNTVYAIRDLLVESSDDPQYQYFGLASQFHVLDANMKFDWLLRGPLHLMVDLDYAQNLGYDRNRIVARAPVNNYGASDASGSAGDYEGGDQAWLAQLSIGYPKILERAQWNLAFGYRDLESDAVLDAFTDSDFHLGGTNAKGYFVGGAYGFTHNAWFTLRYLSATESSGSPYAVDALQVDLNARF